MPSIVGYREAPQSPFGQWGTSVFPGGVMSFQMGTAEKLAMLEGSRGQRVKEVRGGLHLGFGPTSGAAPNAHWALALTWGVAFATAGPLSSHPPASMGH